MNGHCGHGVHVWVDNVFDRDRDDDTPGSVLSPDVVKDLLFP